MLQSTVRVSKNAGTTSIYSISCKIQLLNIYNCICLFIKHLANVLKSLKKNDVESCPYQYLKCLLSTDMDKVEELF